MAYKLGKLPARPGAVKLKMSDYLDLSALPKTPAAFGHQNLVSDYGMLGNDQFGDCVWAGAGHETMLWNAEAGRTVSITAQATLSDYTAVTGFDPADPSTDAGTDMALAAKYRRQTGIADDTGSRHRVAAYLALKPRDLTELCAAAYLFGAVGIGLQMPDYAMTQFDAGKPWDVQHGGQIEGGHYVPVVGRDGNLFVVTWGRLQPMTPAFFQRFNDEGFVYLSQEMLTGDKSPEGFNAGQLQIDLKAVTAL